MAGERKGEGSSPWQSAFLLLGGMAFVVGGFGGASNTQALAERRQLTWNPSIVENNGTQSCVESDTASVRHGVAVGAVRLHLCGSAGRP